MMQMRNDRCEDGDCCDCQPYYSDRGECSSMSFKPHSLSSHSAVGLIEHRISKMDTLAGIAIKYGVEVADIKRMNGLATDLQMFALKSLRIPTPGRHPPSHCTSNGESSFEKIPHRHSDLFDSFRSLRVRSRYESVSPAMSSLQCYYGLQESPSSSRPLSHHRKSRSVANGFVNDIQDTSNSEPGAIDPDKYNEKLVRRRQKSEADFNPQTPGMLLDDNASCNGISVGLALRPKVAGRSNENELGRIKPVSYGSSGSTLSNGVRKSSSTSSLQEQDGAPAPSRWSLKPDFQAISVPRPIFDGLPKPITGRKNKAALD